MGKFLVHTNNQCEDRILFQITRRRIESRIEAFIRCIQWLTLARSIAQLRGTTLVLNCVPPALMLPAIALSMPAANVLAPFSSASH